MKLIINIPDKAYELLKSRSELDNIAESIIANGIPYEERPQGEWIEKVERRGCFAGDKTVYSYTCPFCGVKEFKKYPFCHCGADMRGGAEE